MEQTKNHHMLIRNRNALELTGIIRIESINKEEFILETSFGIMYIYGTDLDITALDLEKGNMNIKGHVSAIEYDDHLKESKQKKGFIKKLFK